MATRATRATTSRTAGVSVTPEVEVTPARPAGMTIGDLWTWLTAGPVSAEVIGWAPDVAVLTSVLLERSHAFRFVVSSPAEGGRWPPQDDGTFSATVSAVAADWRACMDRADGSAPPPVGELWHVVEQGLDTPLEEIAEGRPWHLTEALLLLHTIADEAAAGSAGGAPRQAAGMLYRARAREMLARTGSMSRLAPDRVASLPKTRTTPVGMTHRSLSRYSCAISDGMPAVWHRAPMRRPGAEPGARHANVVLLPWPLRIREADFVPVAGSVRRPDREPFGFFSYEPTEPLDLDLVDRVLDAALEEVDTVDAVVLPEGRLAEEDIDPFEEVLARRHVRLLITGVRPEPASPDRFPGNELHMGARLAGQWWHYRQNKHHRWFLDAAQIESYNIAGALHPSVKWWEAMEIPRRSVNFLELGGGVTIAAVVCEDLARLDGVAQLVRSVGPTLVITLLLDGPQLASRWTSRYAGVLADDPGSAVLTLTAFGMTARSRPHGMPASPVIAMWKDPVRGVREIPLEPGAQGVLLKAVLGRAPRYAADGRAPADDATDLYVAGIHQLRAAAGSHPARDAVPPEAAEPVLTTAELTVLSSWAEAVADAVGSGDRGVVDHVLAQAGASAGWRAAFGLGEPSPELAAAIGALDALTRGALRPACDAAAALAALDAAPRNPTPQARLARVLLRSALDAVTSP